MLKLLIIGAVVAVVFSFRGKHVNPKTSALFEKSTQEKKSAVPNCYLQAADPFFHALPDSEKNKICSSVCPADGEKSKETTTPTAKKDWIFQEGIFDEFSLPGQKRQAYTEVLNRKNREYVIESLDEFLMD